MPNSFQNDESMSVDLVVSLPEILVSVPVPAPLPLFDLSPEHESELELGPVSDFVDFTHSVPQRVVAVDVDVEFEVVLCRKFLKGIVVYFELSGKWVVQM